MIIGHGLLAITGAFFIYDWLRIRKTKQQQKNKAKTIKICLTGGPCGGKSEGIQCIYSTFKQVSAPFFIVPEAATLIGSAGLTLDFASFSGQQIQNFQIYLMRMQYNLESIISQVAQTLEKYQKCPVILCDRGLLDGKAYAGKQNWDRMLKYLKITEDDINRRYQAVIHMQTAARGASSSYFHVPHNEQENFKDDEIKGNKIRKESPEDAIKLDLKIQACYKDHPLRFIIKNYFFVDNFETKKHILLAQVNQILEFALTKSSIEHYYSKQDFDLKEGIRKPSYDQLISDEKIKKLDDKEAQTVAYNERKRRMQKFIKRNNSIIQK